jgi:type IV pilus assembly protein PilN
LRQARERTLAQSAALAALRVDQGVLPRLFAELEGALSAGLQLTNLSLQDGQLELTGLAASSAVVAQFMRELQQSRLLEGLELKQMKAHSQGDQFLLMARLSALST